MSEHRRLHRITRLYLAMPGAPLPPKEEGWYLWGEVEGNDHWMFCQAIVEMIEEGGRRD